MIYFKACRRCSGDVVLEDDIFGSYATCLACGHVTYPDEGVAAGGPDAARSQGAAVVNGSALPFGVLQASSTAR